MLIASIDLECTGVPSEEDPHAVCECGRTDIIDGEIGETRFMLVDPRRPMPCDAQAVHHISDADLFGAPPITTGFMMLMEGRPSFFCAHNAAYEQAFFGGGEAQWLDTYKIALRLWPDAPGHSLQVLRYHLELDCDFDRAHPAHRAGPDSYVGAMLMQRILRDGRADLERMVKWSKGAALLHRVTFGKHKGMLWDELPTDYLVWLRDKSEMDKDCKANSRHRLKMRGIS